MTEDEWTSNTDLQDMIVFVAFQTGMRKSRLFAAACCRRIWHLMGDLGGRDAVALVECLADGLSGEAKLVAVLASVSLALDEMSTPATAFITRADYLATAAAHWLLRSHPDHVMGAAWPAAEAVGREALAAATPGMDLRLVRDAAEKGESDRQRQLLHDIFGVSLFRELRIDPTWLTWHDGIVRRLAATAYQQRTLPSGLLDNAYLAVLADALEEAGCINPDILNHCRQPGEHVRGCWVIDALLGKT
jgi:hypothetical protein